MGYDSDWDKYRFRFLAVNPKCYVCGGKATVVDHFYAHKGDPIKFKDTSNHIPMCKLDHDTITGLFDRHEIPKTEEKFAYINNKRKEFDIQIKIKKIPYKK